jgi:hypothetical protein
MDGQNQRLRRDVLPIPDITPVGLTPFRPDRFAESGTEWSNPVTAGERPTAAGLTVPAGAS